jgi:hypothetical protein
VAGLGVDLDIDLGSDSMNTEHGFIAVAKSHLAEVGKEVSRKSVEVYGRISFTD